MRVPNAMIGKGQAPNTNSKSTTPAQATVSGASLLGMNPITPSKQGKEEPIQANKNSTLGIIGRSAAQMPTSIAKGFTSAIDSIADSPASIKNAVAQMVVKAKPYNYDAIQSANKAAADYKKAADSHILGEGVRSWEQRVEESQQSIVEDNPNSGVAKAGYFVNELGESVGAMAPSIIASAATAGIGGAAVSGATTAANAAQGTVKAASAAANAAKAAKAVSTATKAAGLGTMWVSVFDRSVDEAVAQGNDYNSSSSKAFWDATVEVATEMLTAGIPFLDEGEGLITKAGVFSKNALQKSADKMAASGVQGKLVGRMGVQKAGLAVANSIVRMGEIASQSTGVRKLLLAGAGEAAEEMVAEVLGPVIERATTDPDAPNASIEDIMLAGLGGALISFAMAPLGNVQRFMKENPTREDVVNRARTQLFLSDPDMNLSLAADLVNGEVYGESQIAATQSLIGRSDMAETKGIPFIKGIQDNTRRNQANAVIQAAMDSKRTPADMSNMWNSLSRIWAEEYQYRMDYKLAKAKRDEVRVKYAREYDGVKTATEKVSTLEGTVEAAQKAVDDIKAGGVRKNDPKLKSAEKALNDAKTALSAAQKKLTSEKEIALKKVDHMLSVKSAEDKYGADVVESFRGVEKLKSSRAGLAELTSKNGDTRVFNKQSYFLDRFGVTYEEAVAADKTKAAEMRAEVDKVFDDYRKQIRAKQDQIAADMNKAFADRGLQLRVEFDDSITSRGNYGSGVILLNRSRVQTELGARYVLAHEVLHGVMDQYPTAEQRALFYRDLDGAMAAIGYDFAAAKSVIVTVYEKKYTPRAEAEARRRKLSGEAKSQFIEQYLDNLCTEETYARFMQTAFGSINILKALAEVSPDTLKKAADSLTDSSFGAMVNSIYDYERLLVLDKINKALVDPNFDPEAVKAAQEAALRAEEDARMEAERAEAERVAAEQRKLKEESQRAEDYEASLEWQAGMNPSSFLEEQARENIEMAEDVESQMAWQANIAMSSDDVGIEQPVDEAELWGYTENTTIEGDVTNGREGEVDVRYAEGNEKALFGRRNAGPAAGADEYRSSRRLASGRVWFEGNWKDGRKTAVKPAEYTNEFSYIADEADLPYFTREHLMPYVQAIGELAGHRYEQGKNLLITGDQLEVIGQDRYVGGYHNIVTGETVATTYNRKPAVFHSAIVHEALHDLYRSNNDVCVEFINELEKELVTEEAAARVLDGSVGTYAGGAYTKKFGKASDLYASRNTRMINNYINELHSFLVSGDWMAFTGLSIEDQNALLRVRKKHLKYLDKQLKLKGITIGDGGKLSQLGILNTQSKYPQTYFGGQWDMFSEDLGDADFTMTEERLRQYEELKAKYGAQKKSGYKNGKFVTSEYGDGYQTPNKISDKTAVSQTYATAIGDKNLDDGIRERHMAAVLQGYASHFVITDESAKAYALNRLEGHKETSIKRGKKSEKNVKHRVLDDAYLDATNLLDGGRELSKNEIAYVEQVMAEYLGRIKEANDGALRPNETDNVSRMYDQYERLFAKYAAAGSRYGQNLQAFSMLKKMTPTGRLYYIESMTNHLVSELVDRNGNSRVGGYRFFGKKDAGGKTTYYKDINGKLTPIKISEELRAKMEACTTQEEMDAVELEIIDDIAKQIPPTLGDRVVAWRYLAMLGNPRTHIRNIASNVAMGVTVDFKNAIAGGLEDLVLGNQTEGRTKSLLHRLDPETKAAIKQFVDNDWNSGGMKERTLSGGHVGFQNMVNEQRNKLGVLDPLSKKNSQFLEWEDELSAKRAYTQAFLGYVAASNGKLTVDYLTSNTVESNVALAQARKYAAEEAQKATYRDASLLATRLNEMEKKMGPVGRIVVGGLLPFKKTPINIVKRGVEYSPAGLINGVFKYLNTKAGSNAITIYDPVAKEAKLYTKEMYAQEKYGVAYSALSKENRAEVDERFLLERYTDSFDAIDSKDALDSDKANSRMTAKAKRNRELCNAIDKIASGMTGTMIMMLGYALAHMGIAKGGADEDKDLEYYDQMTGNQEYSVTIFGNNYTLDWLTPVSMPLFAGVEAFRALDGELDLSELTLSEALDILSHVADPVMNLSVLQGINDAMSSYDSGIGKFAQSAAESYIGQFIPTVSGQLARSIDPIRRTTYAPKDAPNGKELTTFANRLKNKVPGLSSTNAAYVDQWGRTQTNSGDTFIERLFANAVAPWYSKEQNRTAVDDYIVGLYTQTGDKGVIPKTPGSTYTIDSTTYYLASDEYQQTKQLVGQLSNLGVTTLMAIPGFSELDPDLQAELVSDAYSFARKVAQNDYAIAKGVEYDVGNSTQRIFNAISAGLTIGQALLISRLDNQIEGTKDKNGKTIRGSKKENTLRFYRSMGLTDAQIKAISTYDYE